MHTGGFIRSGPINESLLIQSEIYFHSGVHLQGVRTYVQLVDEPPCHGNENKVTP